MSNSSNAKPDDHALVERINAGDKQAFEVLYMRYREWVVQLAARFLHETVARDVALDVMQETFFWLAGQFPGFELRAKLKTVLYPVVRNLAYDHLRKNRVRDAHRDRLSETQESAKEVVLPSDRESLGPLRELLQQLPEAQAEVLYLRFVDDLTVEEIAAAVGIPLGTAKTRLFHALKTLRENPETASLYFK